MTKLLPVLEDIRQKKNFSPYVISEFKDFDTVLTLFDTMDACQRAAADLLCGKLEARGKLPVTI